MVDSLWFMVRGSWTRSFLLFLPLPNSTAISIFSLTSRTQITHSCPQSIHSPYGDETGIEEMSNLYPILTFLDSVSSSSSSLEMSSVRSTNTLLVMGFLLVVMNGLLEVWSMGSFL
jgi:hypothetical protein